MSSFSKDVLNLVNKKSKKRVTEQNVEQLASGITEETVKSEEQLRQLIKQVSTLASVRVDEKTTNDIVKAVGKAGAHLGSLESLMKMMIGKK